MGSAKYVGRVGALAVALGVGNVRCTATRMTVTIGVAAVVVTTAVVAAPVPVPPNVKLAADSTALVLGGTSGPTPDDVYIEIVKNQYIAPTHPGQDIDYVPVTSPEELWPFTGLARLLGLAVGDPRIFGPGAMAWPDEPRWKLSGLFDLTADQSVQAGAADLEAAMAEHGNDHLVIYGLSQGAGVANVVKKRLAEQYPAGTTAPDIDFVLSGDPNLPNGGIMSRFPGLYIPILDFTFNGPEAIDTQFHTVEINRQYDGFTDFPLYPLNLVADLNAALGIVYLHTNSFDVSLPADDPTTSPAYQGTHGETSPGQGGTSFYFFDTEDLPLFAPLRMVGVPEPLIDVVEPFFRVIVELGYDRSIRPWEPTPARLIPTTLDPGKVAKDLIDAIGEGIGNAAALVGVPARLSKPAAQTADPTDPDTAPVRHRPAPGSTLKTIMNNLNDGVAQGLTALGSQLPVAPTGTQDERDGGRRTVDRELVASRDQVHQNLGAVRSDVGKRRSIVPSSDNDRGANPATAHPQRKTPVRDAAKNARSDVKKAVTKTSDRIKKALSGGKHGGDGHRRPADGD